MRSPNNIVAFAVVVAATPVASCLLVQAHLPPFWSFLLQAPDQHRGEGLG